MDMILFDTKKEHLSHLKKICDGYCMNKNIDDDVVTTVNIGEAVTEILKRELTCVNILAVDPELDDATRRIRANKKEDYLVLVGEESGELLKYVTPGVRPAGLVLRPAEKSKVTGLLDEISADIASSGKGAQFTFKIRAATYSVALSQIVFFEAANKKVKLRTTSQEFEFTDALEAIEKKLPEEFIRIHKSFVANTNRIAVADFANMSVTFDEGSSAYISRTHKTTLKKYMEKKG